MHEGALSAPTDSDARCIVSRELRDRARDCRRVWRWHWERFWILRWENALRRPGWRVEEEQQAWRRMRAEVRRYAQVRAQIAGMLDTSARDTAALRLTETGIQNSLTTIHR